MYLNITLGFMYLSMCIIMYLAGLTLSRSDTRRQVWFIPLLACAFLNMLGLALLYTTPPVSPERFIAMKVELIGAYFLGPVVLFFIADYCKVKVPKFLKVVMLGISFIFVVLVWSTQTHGLMYEPFIHLEVRPQSLPSGPLRFFPHFYALLCVIISNVIIINRLIKWKPRHRIALYGLLFIALVPTIINIMRQMNILGFGNSPVNQMIISLTLGCIFLWYGIVKLNIFDIEAKGMEMALTYTKEAFLLIDSDNNFLLANESAVKIFPELETMEKYAPMSTVKNFPFSLPVNKAISEKMMFNVSDSNYYTASIDPVTEENGKLTGHIILIQDISEIELLRRKTEKASCIIGRLTLNTSAMTASVDDIDLALSQKEFILLQLFMKLENRGNVLSAGFIYQQVWGQAASDDLRVVKNLIYSLRKKLHGSGYTITAVYKQGYIFEPE